MHPSNTHRARAYYNETEIQTKTVPELPPASTQLLTFIWDTTSISKGNYTIKAYAHPVTGEIILENNLLIDGYKGKTIKGDVTGDYKVDIYDIFQFGRAFGTTPGDARWNPNCDLNNDGIINISDLFYAARNFGKGI